MGDEHVQDDDQQDTGDERMADEQGGDEPQEEALGDLDAIDGADDASPTDAVAAGLRDALGSMREEADRIATLDTGEEQVEAAERFAEQAGTLDEQVGAASRAADERD